MKLSALRALNRDTLIERALARQPSTKAEWSAAHSLVRRELHDHLKYLNQLWVSHKCKDYSNYPRGYAVVLIGLISTVAKFQESHYALTMAFVRESQRFALLETQTAESPFRPIVKRKSVENTTLSNLSFDDDEDRYRVEDTLWRSLRDNDLREAEDYDDYESRQEVYSQMF